MENGGLWGTEAWTQEGPGRPAEHCSWEEHNWTPLGGSGVSYLVGGCLLLLGAHRELHVVGKHDQSYERAHAQRYLLAGEHGVARPAGTGVTHRSASSLSPPLHNGAGGGVLVLPSTHRMAAFSVRELR